MGPTCHSLTLPSPCAAQFAVMKTEVSRSSTPLCVAVVEGDPVFPAGDVAKSTTPLFPSSPPASLPFLSLSFLSSPWTAFEQLALAGPIRELLFISPKSTVPEVPPRP